MRARHLLYILYLPMLLLEWVVDLIGKLWQAFHLSIIDLTKAIKAEINEPDKSEPTA
jgi:hypothetical protein